MMRLRLERHSSMMRRFVSSGVLLPGRDKHCGGGGRWADACADAACEWGPTWHKGASYSEGAVARPDRQQAVL